ncbi:hypothetical protein D3C73_1591210 [compost metagenome]
MNTLVAGTQQTFGQFYTAFPYKLRKITPIGLFEDSGQVGSVETADFGKPVQCQIFMKIVLDIILNLL